jgi:Fe-Mn family superoxide dismutase
MVFTLPALPYSFDALEPHIDSKTMEIHHDKHHAAYIAKLNAALEKEPSLQNLTIEELIKNPRSLPEGSRSAIVNNGGGHFNHSLLWKTLSPKGGGAPKGDLLKALETDFGGFDGFKEKFSAAALGQFGSGWAWLCAGPSKRLSILGLPNQDSPLASGLVPIFGIDIWEHAYYLKYQNRRADYIAAIWNLVGWDEVAANFEGAKAGH